MSAEPTTWKEELLARVRAAERSEPRKRDQLDPETLADVLLLDAGLASASREAAFDLPFPHLLQISRTLGEAFERGGAAVVLPFGTPAIFRRQGSVEIGGNVWAVRIMNAGLERLEALPRGARGRNLETLRLIVFNHASSETERRFGLPFGSSVGGDGVVTNSIEFPPMAELGGAVLRYDVDRMGAAAFCTASITTLERFVAGYLKDIHRLWRRRDRVARRVNAAREAAERGIRAAGSSGTAVTVARICIDGHSVSRPGEPRLLARRSVRDLTSGWRSRLN